VTKWQHYNILNVSFDVKKIKLKYELLKNNVNSKYFLNVTFQEFSCCACCLMRLKNISLDIKVIPNDTTYDTENKHLLRPYLHRHFDAQ